MSRNVDWIIDSNWKSWYGLQRFSYHAMRAVWAAGGWVQGARQKLIYMRKYSAIALLHASMKHAAQVKAQLNYILKWPSTWGRGPYARTCHNIITQQHHFNELLIYHSTPSTEPSHSIAGIFIIRITRYRYELCLADCIGSFYNARENNKVVQGQGVPWCNLRH